ncbi:MAG: hypothetical protein DWQ02_27875 [Bacteroidetes bacterium]|nr:MAG: hypothetical protein DWQ02_27875 [Bacteroidota bacterium]
MTRSFWMLFKGLFNVANQGYKRTLSFVKIEYILLLFPTTPLSNKSLYKKTKMKTGLTLALSFFFFTFLFAQNPKDRPDIFIDCQMYCDMVYIKQEIRFVNYMQNRQEADIYILATRQRTGAGGNEIQMAFIGNNEFSAIRDTIRYFTDPNATDAINREQMVKELKKGLLQFLVQTPMIDQIAYQVESANGEAENTEVDDPWNYWVFNIGGNSWLNGESTYANVDLTGRFSASKITDKHKLRFSTFYNFEKSTFKLTDGDESFIRRSYNVRLTYVKSLGSNWSAGFRTRTGFSTFGNTDLSTTFKPAIEYNIFPYEEASTRRFSFFYSIGPEYYNYTDTTVYNRLYETRMRHGLDIEFNQTQKWGNISLDIGVEQYLHDFNLFSTYINPNIEWQIFKGLSIDIGGFASFVSDRINIAKSDISDEDILLQIKQLDTDFTYFTYIGLNYRFGSKYNNFVNPRF